MTFLEQLLRPPPADPASRPPFPGAESTAPPRFALAGLLVLCAVPRFVTAWRLGTFCDDAYYYFSVACALEEGNFSTALRFLNLNVYPAILASLHRLGLEWGTAGKLWGASVGSLAVLPLYGWVRRVFDARVALAAGFLYAVHPELIELSAEPIREPTFWFFLNLCLYLTWVAVERARVRWFVAAGAAMILAVYTRVEGVLLLLPLVAWSIPRFRSLGARRRWKLAAGALLWVAAVPAAVMLVNVTVLRDHYRWELGRMDYVQEAWAWVDSWLPEDQHGPEAGPGSDTAGLSQAAGTDRDANSASGSSVGSGGSGAADGKRGLLYYLEHLPEGVDPVHLALLIVGLMAGRRWLLRPGTVVPPLMMAAALAAIWIRLRRVGSINDRYFLTAYLVAIPFAGLGLLAVLDRCARWAELRLPGRAAGPRLAAAVLAAGLLAGWADAATTRHTGREAEAAAGRWLRREKDAPGRVVVVDFDGSRMGYVACGTMPRVVGDFASVERRFGDDPPAMVILPRRLAGEAADERAARAERLGLERIELRRFPAANEKFLVYRRTRGPGRVAGGAAAGERRR